jgi:uncharacterized membrane protein
VNRKLISLTAALAFMTSPAIAAAQAPAASASSQRSVGPTIAANTVGVRAPSATRALNARAADTHMGAGTNVALMVVGGAAIIIGAIIGETAGLLIAVAGAAIGLYGLYYFIQ